MRRPSRRPCEPHALLATSASWTALALGLLFAVLASGQGIITTVAGNPTCCNGADGGPATARWLTAGNGLATDASGNIYFYETASSIVRKIDGATGILTTYAGNRNPGFSGDDGPATNASLFPLASNLSGIAFDSAGNLYIADGNNHRVRRVSPDGVITTYAGNGAAGFAGDNGQARAAQLNFPAGLAVDSGGNLYIADSSNNRIRKVTPGGIITTFAGNGNVSVPLGDGGPAIAAAVNRPIGLAFDAQGNLYVSETSSSRVRKITPEGTITLFAGQAVENNGFSGDGGPATAAQLNGPLGLVADQFGNIFIADGMNSRIRKVDAAGIVTTIAGISGNASTPIGDGGPSTSAFLGNVRGLATDSAGNLYLSASAAGVMRVRKIAATGAGFIAAPSSLSFSATTGGSEPPPQSVSITSSGAPLGFTATPTSTGNWLTVTPGSGTTPASLSVGANPAGLGAGTYNGTITLTPGGSGNSPLAINVTLVVSGAGAPAISSGGILNATGYQAKLAPDTVFVIFGSNLGPSTLQANTASSYPDSLAGTSITFTPVSGGNVITAKMVYTSAGQVAGLLPSSITPGAYGVRVSYNGLTSAPQNVTVVARSFGIAAANSAGSGLAQATIGNINNGLSLTRFTPGSVQFNGFTWTLSPAHPGDTVILWGTGGGADPANDTGGSSGDQTAQGNFRVLIQGRPIVPLYAGTSVGYPGLWQINFILPNDIAPDCFATVQVSAGGELGNSVIIPIAEAGQNSCVDPSMPAGIFSKLDAGGTITAANFALAKLTATPSGITQETASGAVFRYTAAEWMILNSGPLFGACRVYDRTFPVAAKDPGAASTSLDAGSQLPVLGPGLPGNFGLARGNAAFGPFYGTSPGPGTLRTGTYTLTGPGGSQVGPFSASTVFPASFTATNWDSITSINRAQPLTLNWTGSGFDKAAIVVSTTVNAGGMLHITTINCMVPGAPGTYTIPAAALAYLSQASTTGTAFGSLSLQGVSAVGTFTAPLTGGAQTDIGGFQGNLGVSKNIAVQ